MQNVAAMQNQTFYQELSERVMNIEFDEQNFLGITLSACLKVSF